MSSHPRTDLFRQAIDHHAAGRLEQAHGIYRQILAWDSGHVDCHFRLGLLARAIGRPALALEHFEATVRLRPRAARCRLRLGMTRDAPGRRRRVLSRGTETSIASIETKPGSLG
jgi:tetratricopeptide (TPR) repeat protein